MTNLVDQAPALESHKEGSNTADQSVDMASMIEELRKEKPEALRERFAIEQDTNIKFAIFAILNEGKPM